MAIQIQLRRGTSVQWSTANTILAEAEIAVELDTYQYKIGDGYTNWSDLPYGGIHGPMAGIDTEVVFNNKGIANGSIAFTFDYTTNTLNLSNTLIVSNTISTGNLIATDVYVNTLTVNNTLDVYTLSVNTDLTVGNTLTVTGELIAVSNLEVYDTLNVNNNVNVLNTITTNNSIVYSTLDVYDVLNVNNTLNITNTLVVSNTASIANVLTFGNNFILGANLNNGELEQIGPALVLGTDASILSNGPESIPWYAPQGGSFATEQHLFFANASLVQVGNSSSYFNLYNDSLSFYDIAGNKAGSISVASLDVDALTANTLVIDGVSSGSVGSDSISANTITVTTSITVGDETTGISINATSFTGTSNNTLYVGDVYYDNVVSNSQLSANLENYSNTFLMLANDATTYSNAVYYTDTIVGLVNTAIGSNAATTYSNAVYYTDTVVGRVNTAISSNAATTYSNAVLYTDTVVGRVNTAITSNASTTYSNAVYYTDTVVGRVNTAITSNAATTYSNAVYYTDTVVGRVNTAITANAATTYANAVLYTDTVIGFVNSAIISNVYISYSNSVNYTDTKIGLVNTAITSNASSAYSNAVYYTDTVIGFVNTAITANSTTAYSNAVTFASNASNISTGTINEGRLPYRMDQNVRKVDDVEFHNITITGMIVSGNVTVIGSNNLSISDNMIYLNSNNFVTNPDLGFAGNYYDGVYHHAGFFRDASDGVWKVFENYKPEPDASPYIDTGNNTFRIANFQANTIYIGNTNFYATINNTSYSGSANNSTYLNGNTASDLRTYSETLSTNAYANSVLYTDTKIGLVNTAITANAATAYSNAVAYTDTKASASYANAVTYVDTKIGLVNTAITANASAAYSNAVSYVDTKIGLVNTAITANAATAYSNAVAYVDNKLYVNTYSLSTNLTNYAQLSGATFSGDVTLNKNLYATYIVGTNGLLIEQKNAASFLSLKNNGYEWKIYPSGPMEMGGSLIGGSYGANKLDFAGAAILEGGNFGSQIKASNDRSTYYTWTFGGDGVLTLPTGSKISANGTTGTVGQILTSNGTVAYWANTSGGFSNGQSISVNNFVVNGALTANSSNGSYGQVLTSNGTSVYWAAAVSPINATSQTFTGNGSSTTFTLSLSVADQKNIIVSLNGLLQVPVTHYTISGTVLTFTDAPFSGSIVEVRNMEGVVISGGSGSVSASITITPKSAAYTLQASDNGGMVSITTGGVTVPSGVLTAGMNVTIYNNSSSSQTITQGSSVTMYLAGATTPTTGNRTLGPNGLATIICVGTDTFTISGPGLS